MVKTSSVVGEGLREDIAVTTDGVSSCAAAALARSSNVGKTAASMVPR